MRSLLPLFALLCCGGNQPMVRETAGLVYVQEVIARCESPESCDVRIVTASGSATRIAWQGEFYWLSAGHVCASLVSPGEVSVSRQMKVTTLGQEIETAEDIPIAVHRDDVDLCLMRARPGAARTLSNRTLESGEGLRTLAFPNGGYSTKMFPLYEGTHNGQVDEFTCLTNLPVAPGSSGAGLIDRKGRLVGVVTSVSAAFNHFTMYACSDVVVWFTGLASQVLKTSGESRTPEQLDKVP